MSSKCFAEKNSRLEKQAREARGWYVRRQLEAHSFTDPLVFLLKLQ